MISLKTSRTDPCRGCLFNVRDPTALMFQKSGSLQFENSQGGIARKSRGAKITVLLCFLLAERDKMKEENG